MNETLMGDDLDLLDGVVAESIEPIAPPPDLRRRILDTIRAIGSHRGTWKVLPFPGVKMKTVSVDDERGTTTILLSFEPGASFPAHDHHGEEQSFVVSGSCRIGSVHLFTGDFHRAEAGSHHGDVVSDEGCVLLLVVDSEDCRAA